MKKRVTEAEKALLKILLSPLKISPGKILFPVDFAIFLPFNVSTTSSIDIASWKQLCYDAMNDDFNTPILIAQLFEAVRYVNLLKEGKETISAEDLKTFTTAMNAFVFDVLGLSDDKAADSNNDKLEGVVNMLIGMRNQARADKNFALSDQIRDQLIALGIQLKDGKEGTSFSI